MPNMKSYLIILGLFVGTLVLGGYLFEIKPGTWEFIIPLNTNHPEARHDAGFVCIDDTFYLLGGREGQVVSFFNTQTQRWTDGSTPPTAIHHFQPVVYNDEVYILGAMTGDYPSETPLPCIYIYNPKADTWRTGDTIPESRRRGAVGTVLYQGAIYLVGGIRDGHRGDHKNWLDRYDLETGTWEVLPDAPRPRDHFAAVVADDQLYLAGGRLSKSEEGIFNFTIPEVDVYDFNTRQWTTLEHNLPTPRAGTAAILYHGELLIIGGESGAQESAHHDVEALDLDSYTWKRYSGMREGRHGICAILWNDKVYVASGCTRRGGAPEVPTMEAFSLDIPLEE
ncbi:MAG: galactose oxidase [Bacteroidetes bacterium]|nr:MAG: galactose oxidase [Bacteroidota bacterium]